MNTSFSALNTFKTCPLKYKFQIIDKIKTPKSPEAVFGSLVHSTMKFIHTGDFIFPTLKEALNYFSSNWNSEIFEDEIRERAAFALGIRIVQEYYKKNGIAPMVRILSKVTGYKLKYIYELFPSGPGKGACKMAGLPKPTGCV